MAKVEMCRQAILEGLVVDFAQMSMPPPNNIQRVDSHYNNVSPFDSIPPHPPHMSQYSGRGRGRGMSKFFFVFLQ